MGIIRINQFPSLEVNELTNDDIFLVMNNPDEEALTKKLSLANLSAAITPSGYVTSNISGISGASIISNMVGISQNDYDSLVTKDPDTLYVIQ
jgi:hypothetical protein